MFARDPSLDGDDATSSARTSALSSQATATTDSLAGSGGLGQEGLRQGPRQGGLWLEDQEEDDEIPAASNDVLMALEMRTNGMVGCAYFIAATATLYLHEDTRICGFELVESLLLQAQPTSVLIPSRAPESLVAFLDRQSCAAVSGGIADQEDRGFEVQTAASSDFSPDAGKRALAQLKTLRRHQPRATFFTTAVEEIEDYVAYGHAEDRPVGVRPRNGLMHLGTSINLDNRVTLGCVAALLHDLEQRQAAAADKDTGLFQVKSIQTVSYKNCMFVTADTLLALQILRPDLRQVSAGARAPSGKEGGTAPDSRSVSDLFHSLASTTQGRARLRELFVRPSTDMAVIEARHRSISTLLLPENRAAVAAMRASLRKVKNMRPLMLNIRSGLLLPGRFSAIRKSAWANLLDFCTNVLRILTSADQTLHGSCDIVDKASSEIDARAICEVQGALLRVVDFEESKSAGRNVVASGVSQDLDALKSHHSSLQARLEEICDSYRQRLPRSEQSNIIGCIFHPQLGYLLVAGAALRARIRNRAGGSASPQASPFYACEEALEEDGLVYLKTPELDDIDGEFGDLNGQIIGLELDIFYRLGSEILEEEDALLRASDAVGDIDSILALARGAEMLHLVRPRMTQQNVLHIQKGRHLLQELGPGVFVPNDCRLAGGSGTGDSASDSAPDYGPGLAASGGVPSAVVLTGPNHSGKSVYLKQVATIVYLAHVGSFVPADEAVVGITDKILTRIATRESVSRDESAFGVDLRQAAFSINMATRRSLILIDEFGKGTATVDGAALFDALLHHFLSLGPESSPRVLAATHFHEIFASGSLEQHPRLGLAHMRVTVDPSSARPEEGVRFLHRLQDGRSTESFGCHCAAISGVAAPVVERAGQIAELLTRGMSLERICLGNAPGDVQRLRQNEGRARLFLAEMAEALDADADADAGTAWQTPRRLLRLVFADADADQGPSGSEAAADDDTM